MAEIGYIDRQPAMNRAVSLNIPYDAFIDAFGYAQEIRLSIYNRWVTEQGDAVKRRYCAALLKQRFPWLGTDLDAGSGADVICNLAELYEVTR